MDIQLLQEYRNRGRGIYFLIDNNDIVYIGRTSQLYIRILEHAAEGKKQFDNFYCIVTNHLPITYEVELEMSMICFFKPIHNKIIFDSYFNWYHSIPYVNQKKEDRIENLDKIETETLNTAFTFKGMGINMRYSHTPKGEVIGDIQNA